MEHFLIMGNLPVQPAHRGLQLLVLLLQTGTLFDKDVLAGFFGAIFEKQGYVLNQCFNLNAGAAHAFYEFYLATGRFVKIADAVIPTRDVGNETDAFIVTDRISGQTVFFTDFFDGHIAHLISNLNQQG